MDSLPQDPVLTHARALESFAKLYTQHACKHHDAALQFRDPDLRDSCEDISGVLFALGHALEVARAGDYSALDELASLTVTWLADQRIAALGGATLSEVAFTDPELN